MNSRPQGAPMTTPLHPNVEGGESGDAAPSGDVLPVEPPRWPSADANARAVPERLTLASLLEVVERDCR